MDYSDPDDFAIINKACLGTVLSRKDERNLLATSSTTFETLVS
jgi:hypothetical protein